MWGEGGLYKQVCDSVEFVGREGEGRGEGGGGGWRVGGGGGGVVGIRGQFIFGF